MLEKAEHDEFTMHLANRTCAETGTEEPAGLASIDFHKVLFSGNFAARAHRGEEFPRRKVYPWEKDRCQYHRHTELGLPCYRSKR